MSPLSRASQKISSSFLEMNSKGILSPCSWQAPKNIFIRSSHQGCFPIASSSRMKTWCLILQLPTESRSSRGPREASIFSSALSIVGLPTETFSGEMTAFHWAVVGLGRNVDLCTNSAICKPPKWSMTVDHMMSSLVYPFSLYNFTAARSYCEMRPLMPTLHFKPAWTNVETHSTLPLTIARIHCLWSASEAAWVSSFWLSLSLVRCIFSIWSIFHLTSSINPPIGWWSKVEFRWTPCWMWSIMALKLSLDRMSLHAQHALPSLWVSFVNPIRPVHLVDWRKNLLLMEW